MNGPLVVLFVCIALLHVDGMPIDDASARNHHYFHENLDHFTAQILGPLFGTWIGGSQKFGYKGSVNGDRPEFQPTELLLGSGSEDVGRSISEYEELLFGPNGGDRPEFQYGGLVPGYGLADVGRPISEYEELLFGSNGGDRPEFPYGGLVLGSGSAHLGRPGFRHNEWLFVPEGGDSRS